MAKAATRTKDDDDDGKMPVVRGSAKAATVATATEPEVPPAGVVVGPLPEGMDASDMNVVDPQAYSDVAPGFTPGTVPGAGSASAIKTDTPTYGTETPPRQTPPSNLEKAIKHSPPSFHDSNGQKITSLAPTLSGISPATAVAVTGPDLTVTATGTNFDRATFLTANGVIMAETVYVSATSLTVLVRPSLNVAGVIAVTAKNPAGESAPQNFTFT